MVEVVGEPDVDTARSRADERVPDDGLQRIRQPEGVDRDLERFLGRREETGERVRNVLRRLAAVGERPELYRAAFARCSAL